MFSLCKRAAPRALLSVALLLSLVMPDIVGAQLIVPCPPGGAPCYGGADGFYTPDIPELPDADRSLTDLIVDVISFVLDFVLLLGIVMVIIAGLYLIVSMGDEAAKEKAKKIILYLVIGIILIIFARVLVLAVARIGQG